MMIRSISQIQLEDPETDYGTAESVGRIRMSDQAFYFTGFPGTRYLPFTAIRRVWVQKSSVKANCSCGGINVPVVRLHTIYDRDSCQSFTFQWEKEADGILARLKEHHPEIPQGPESK